MDLIANEIIKKMTQGKLLRILTKLCFLLIAVFSFSFTPPAENNAISNDIRIERHKPVRMSDGVTLYADLYLPAEPGRYPTIVSSTPYGVQRDGSHEMFVKFAQHGYAVVYFD